jgi:hypothetical protein
MILNEIGRVVESELPSAEIDTSEAAVRVKSVERNHADAENLHLQTRIPSIAKARRRSRLIFDLQ